MTEKNFHNELALVRRRMKQPLKNADNPFFKSKYVPFENIVQVVDEAFAESEHLFWFQEAIRENGKDYIQTAVCGFDEKMVFSGCEIKPTKNDPQALGSAITYAKRYSLAMAFGIACDIDDDGNKAAESNIAIEEKYRGELLQLIRKTKTAVPKDLNSWSIEKMKKAIDKLNAKMEGTNE